MILIVNFLSLSKKKVKNKAISFLEYIHYTVDARGAPPKILPRAPDWLGPGLGTGLGKVTRGRDGCAFGLGTFHVVWTL